MNTWGIAGFTAAYVLVALLLLNVLFCTRWMWWVKLASLAMVAALYAASYRSLPLLLGWPTGYALPHRFNLVGLHIMEPDKSGTNKGSIYFWVTDMNLSPGHQVPRAYVFPFSPELQLKAVEAGNKLRKNLPQLGEIDQERRATNPHGAPETELYNLQFFDMPDPLFPEK